MNKKKGYDYIFELVYYLHISFFGILKKIIKIYKTISL